jgi:hypothetical protein
MRSVVKDARPRAIAPACSEPVAAETSRHVRGVIRVTNDVARTRNVISAARRLHTANPFPLPLPVRAA